MWQKQVGRASCHADAPLGWDGSFTHGAFAAIAILFGSPLAAGGESRESPAPTKPQSRDPVADIAGRLTVAGRDADVSSVDCVTNKPAVFKALRKILTVCLVPTADIQVQHVSSTSSVLDAFLSEAGITKPPVHCSHSRSTRRCIAAGLFEA